MCIRDRFEDLRTNGCVMSELPPGTPPLPEHFPSRNRILSGLALGSVVVEAPKKSGALITARHALEQGRDVFTLPGNLGNPTCAGNIQLLKQGAILVEEGWDILQEYTYLYPELPQRQRPAGPMTLTAQDVYKRQGQRRSAIPLQAISHGTAARGRTAARTI